MGLETEGHPADRTINAGARGLHIWMGNAGVFSYLHSLNFLNHYSATLSVGNSKKSYSLCISVFPAPGICACLLKD